MDLRFQILQGIVRQGDLDPCEVVVAVGDERLVDDGDFGEIPFPCPVDVDEDMSVGVSEGR